MSRADLARSTDLTPATVSAIVAELQAEGLVGEGRAEPDQGRIGKPPVMLSVAGDARSIVAVDLSGRQPRSGILDLNGNIVSLNTCNTNDASGDGLLERIIDFVAETAAEAPNEVLGIGIGTPGLVDGWRTVVQASAFDWHDVPLAQLVEERTGHDTSVSNDANVAALAEFSQGSSGPADLAVIMIGSGVGAGFILNNQPFKGLHSAAGEIGHLVVDPNGPLCRCGNRGCVETFVALPAFAELIANGQDTVDVEQLETLRRSAGHHLGIALAAVVASVGVDTFFIAGGDELLGPDFCHYVTETVKQRCLAAAAESLQVNYTSLGEHIVLRGAGSLVVSRQLGVA